MSTVAGFAVFLLVCFLLLLFAATAVFVVIAASKWDKSRKELEKVDVTDGIDAAEWAIIRKAFAKNQAKADETAVKAKMAAVAATPTV